MRALSTLSIAVATLGGCTLLSGCTLINPPSAHTGGEIPVERFCDELADLSCQGHIDCCPISVRTYDECIAQVAADCRTGLEPYGTDPRAGYDVDAAARALDAGRDLAARCDPAIVDWFTARDGLQGALTGTVAPGAECVSEAADVSVPALLSCEDLGQVCRVQGGFPWRCGPRSELSGPCHLDLDCMPDAYCNGEVVLLSAGQCMPRRATGDACTGDEQCTSQICVDGLCVARTIENTYCGIGAEPEPAT